MEINGIFNHINIDQVDEPNNDVQISAGYFENDVHQVIRQLRELYYTSMRVNIESWNRLQRPSLLMSADYGR